MYLFLHSNAENSRCYKISANDKENYQRKAAELNTQKVIPEYQKFYAFFTKEYMTNCRQNVGISPFKGGKEYYQYLIEFYTTTSMLAEEIHQ
ncbi:DUF885 family protein [Colwellia sp. MB3u-28]|nr:DUF885 family protein [Colwellia sp. MB3u-28]MBA6259079.1 DUF885 family protein [Colwellia sp. MB3u-41]MBA6302113.1 DUF885 family protein [Colwellia sp. MB02u-14]